MTIEGKFMLWNVHYTLNNVRYIYGLKFPLHSEQCKVYLGRKWPLHNEECKVNVGTKWALHKEQCKA